MKSTGIIRHIDSLGRFKLPRELLDSYNIEPQSKLRIYKRGKNIILDSYKHGCIFCFSTENIHFFKGKKICKKCIDKINTLKKYKT